MREVIEHGYQIPFIRLPDPVFCRNHKSAFEHASFVKEAIGELVAGSCVVQCAESPAVCSPLSVVISGSGKKHLVLDLRYVNQFILMKYEGLNIVLQLCGKGDYFVTFDLKSGYHHVDIHVDCWRYLGFSWGEASNKKWYTFKVLPFGLVSACCFHKVIAAFSEAMKEHGVAVHCLH